MLSDICVGTAPTGADISLNALSSIVCFLTYFMNGEVIGFVIESLNALSSIVCFLTILNFLDSIAEAVESQCPLEHCMLSD